MATTVNSKIQILNPSDANNLLFPRVRLEDIRNSGNTEGILTADGKKIASTYIDVNSTTTIPATNAQDTKLPTEKAVKDYVDQALVAGVASVTGTAPVTATTNAGVVTLGITSATSTNSGIVRLASNVEAYFTSTGNNGVVTATQFARAMAVIAFTSSANTTDDGAISYPLSGGNLKVNTLTSDGISQIDVGLASLQALGYCRDTSALGKFISTNDGWVFRADTFVRNVGVKYGGTTHAGTMTAEGIATLFTVDNTKSRGVGLVFDVTNNKLSIQADLATGSTPGVVATKADCTNLTAAEKASAALVPTVGALVAASAAAATAASASATTVANTYSTYVATGLASCLVYSTITE